MSKEGKGRILPHVRGGLYVYISKDVANDSNFPFKKSEDIKVKIKEKKIIIEKS